VTLPPAVTAVVEGPPPECPPVVELVEEYDAAGLDEALAVLDAARDARRQRVEVLTGGAASHCPAAAA